MKMTAPRKDNNGRPIKYESPTGIKNRAYFPAGIADRLNDPTCELLITEGEKKALRAIRAAEAEYGINRRYDAAGVAHEGVHWRPDGGHEIPTDDAYKAWSDWCIENDRKPGPKAVFGRDFRAACPSVEQVKRREGEKRPRIYLGIQLRSR